MIENINLANQELRPVFIPTDKQREYIGRVYSDFVFDYQIKNQNWQLLNNRTLQQFWEDSNYDYNNIVIDDPSDPVTQYSSGITRDKANAFIQNLSMAQLFPSVTAQNANQEIDQIVTRVARPILEFQHLNDGRPSESGKLKNTRYVHKQVNEGTVHIQDNIDPETGRLNSTVIPNEEVFIPNFYQPDVQKQTHFMRVIQFSSFQELEAEFGDLPNFKYIHPGNLGWMNTIENFKEKYKATVVANQITVIYAWYPVPRKALKQLIASNKLPSWVKKAKYFNILANGIPLFADPENLMPYYHGEYPVSKGIFESFSTSEFYWGNSMPNKCRQDKKFLDGWKTLIRYKAKLGAIPPLLNFTGQHVDGDIMIPGNIADMPANFDPSKISVVPGISSGVTSGDMQMMTDTTRDIDRATAAPQTSDQSGPAQTARESILVQENAQKAMLGLAMNLGFLAEARSFHILKSSFQFMPRQMISKLSIPSQVFPDGVSGTLEVIFQKLPKMTEDEKLDHSINILQQETKAKKQGVNKKIVYLDKEYIQHLDLYCKAAAETAPVDTPSIREAKAEQRFATYSSRPDLFNEKRAARNLVREYGDDETQMINDSPPQPGQPGAPAQANEPQGGPQQGALPPGKTGKGTTMNQPQQSPQPAPPPGQNLQMSPIANLNPMINKALLRQKVGLLTR